VAKNGIQKRSIGVVGLGHWGTALAHYLARLGHSVTGWSREEEIVRSITQTKKHPHCFLQFPLLFNATTELSTISKSEIVLVALPTRVIREYDFASRLDDKQYLVSVMKGFEPLTNLTPCAYYKEQGSKAKLCSLSGPSFAIDVMTKTPVAVSIASAQKQDAQFISELFQSSSMRVYPSDDVIGVELGGALKNIIAVASGICAGLKLGDSTKAALITRGLAEMTRFSLYFGGKPQTLSGLSGLGDLILTTSSMTSRNYSFGYKIGEGLTAEKAADEVGSTAEGVFSTPVVDRIAKKHGISMPITEALHRVLHGAIQPDEMGGLLMSRPAGEE
jgi:glycerol-3-phosphate dehydrogenase (NAD(P)+)